MPPLIPEAEAGPSKKRISTFKSHSEGESDYEEEEPIVKRKKSKLNGHSEKRQKINGISNGDKGDKRRKLEKRAGELLEMRQDLPFYQGTPVFRRPSNWKWADGKGGELYLMRSWVMKLPSYVFPLPTAPFSFLSTAWNGSRRRRTKQECNQQKRANVRSLEKQDVVNLPNCPNS
jgi:hypothetical protein